MTDLSTHTLLNGQEHPRTEVEADADKDISRMHAYTSKEKNFLRRLEAFFDAHSLKPMSKRFAYNYVQV